MAHRRRVILLALLGLLVLTVAGTAAFLADNARVKGFVERTVSDATGRPFTIGGAFHVDWGRHLGVTAEQIELGNADWAKKPQMLELGRLHVVLDLWSLVSGPVDLERLEIRDLDLQLQGRNDGPANWVLNPQATTPSESAGAGPAALLGRLTGTNVRIEYQGPGVDRPVVVALDRISQDLRPDHMLDLAVAGTINDETLTVDGEIGPFENLRVGRDVRLNLEGKLGQGTVRADGLIDDIAAPRQPRVNLAIAGPDVGRLSERLGLGRVGEGPFDFTARVGPADQGVSVSGKGKFGRIDLDIGGRVRDLAGLDGLELSADASGPDLGAVVRAFGIEGPADPFELQARVTRDGPRLEVEKLHFAYAKATLDGSAELRNFPTLESARIDLRMTGSQLEKLRSLLGVPGVSTGPYALEVQVARNADGPETLATNLTTSLGRSRITGTLGQPRTLVGTRVEYKIEGPSLAAVGEALSVRTLPAEPFTITGEASVPAPKSLAVKGLVAEIGEDRFNVDGRFDFAERFQANEVNLAASGDNLAAVLAAVGVNEGIPDAGYEVRGQLGIDNGQLRLADVKGTVGRAEVAGEGTIGLAPGIPGTDLDFRVSGPDLHEVVAVPAALEYVPATSFDVRATMRGADEGIAFDGIKATVADASLQGSGLIGIKPGLVGSRLQVSASGPDLSQIAPELPGFSPAPGPFEIQARLDLGADDLGVRAERLAYGGVAGRVELHLGLPFQTATSRFSVDLQGPDASVLPALGDFRPAAVAFSVKGGGARTTDTWRIDALDARLGDAQASVKGSIPRSRNSTGGELSINTSAPSVAQLGTWDGEPLLDFPLELSAELTGKDGTLESRHLSARVGNTDLEGRLRYTQGDVPTVDATLHSNHLDVREWVTGEESPEKAPAKTDKSQAAGGGPMIPDTPLPLAAMRRVNLTVDYTADQATLKFADATDVRIEAGLVDGALDVRHFDFSERGGTLTGALSVAPEPGNETARVSLNVQAQGIGSGTFARRSNVGAAPQFDADISLAARGGTWHQLVTGLNGQAWLTSKDGEISNEQFSNLLLADFLSEVFTAIIPSVESEKVAKVECIALPFVVDDGVARSSPDLVIRTTKVNILARGQLNLATEAVDFAFKTQPRKGVGLSASQLVNPFIKVGGTVSEPHVILDPAGTLATGAATVATGGVWLLLKGPFESLFSSKDPCGTTMEQHAKEMAKRGQ